MARTSIKRSATNTATTDTSSDVKRPEQSGTPSTSLSGIPGGEAGVSGASEAPADASAAPATGRPKLTKLGQIRSLLAAPSGASLAALCAATGWQSHSVRAALTGLRKTGAAIEKSKDKDGTTVYRLAVAAEAEATLSDDNHVAVSLDLSDEPGPAAPAEGAS